MIKVALLLDKSNDWIDKHIPSDLSDTSEIEFHKIYDEKKAQDFDIVFLLGYTKIIKDKTLKSNKLLLVVHESELPKGRGFAPLQWQILEGAKDITICLIEALNLVDSGDIYEKTILSLDGTELYDEIRSKQAKVTFELITRFLRKYPNHSASRQMGEATTYPRRTAKDSKLNIDKTIRDQYQLHRVCNNNDWPAFFEHSGSKYILKIYKDE